MLFETKITARYAETDQMGVIHHAVYPVWYEVARTDFIKAFGISYSQMEQMGIMLPLIELSCNYKKPAHYEDELTIKVHISLLTHVKIEFTYEIFNVNGELIHVGSTLHAWTNLELKPISMKKQFPEIFHLIQKAQKG